MNRYAYDGSFDGFLCTLAAAWHDEAPTIEAETEAPQGSLFGEITEIETSDALADRVRAALGRRIGSEAMRRLYRVFLSEQPGIERTLFDLVRAMVERGVEVMTDFRFGPAWRVERLAQQVGREVHRMHAFVRFEQGEGDRYVAFIEPDFNVLPLIGAHFEARYPAMCWAIVDRRRRHGLLHDEAGTCILPIEVEALGSQEEDEQAFQRMWQTYFQAVTIPERSNPRLHLQHVPRRYWPMLTEMQELGDMAKV